MFIIHSITKASTNTFLVEINELQLMVEIKNKTTPRNIPSASATHAKTFHLLLFLWVKVFQLFITLLRLNAELFVCQ